MSKADPKHAAELQKKIFGRWVKLKLSVRHIKFNDTLKDLSDGLNLISLLEILSDKEYQNKKKLVLAPKMRPQILDNCAQALSFCWEVGVDMKLKPSAENLADGNETMVLGLLWAIMLKFMTFGDEDDAKSLNARDALLMWVQNQVITYSNVKVENMTKSFHDGLALCALIHKFRPKLIPYEKLDASHAEDNLKLAFAAAEKFLGLEQYLTPADIQALDEKSMVVYVSEYYYGIAQQRKVDLAARRITKLIKFTKDMDAKKADYVTRSKQLRVQVDAVSKLLNDRTIDNTMAGAKKKLEDFYGYKTNDKGVITDTYLSIESVFNQLALKLADNHRPAFKPEAGCSIPELRQNLSELEVVEKERKVALHAELNRQIKLAKTYEVHGERFAGFDAWQQQQTKYLETKEDIHSVGAAEFQLNTLAASKNEYNIVVETIVVELKTQGHYLVEEKFEFSSEVQTRLSKIDEAVSRLKTLADAKLLVLEDHLARERFAEKVRGWNKQHLAKSTKLVNFITEKKTYFGQKETVNSVSDANLHLSILLGHRAQQKDLQAAATPALQALGAKILEAKYETSYSRWVFEDPEGLKARESSILAGFEECDRLSDHKLAVLQDDVARETLKDEVLLKNKQHVDKHDKLSVWLADSLKKLTTKEVITSIGDANLQLSLLHSWMVEKKDLVANNYRSLCTLGKEILEAKYETKYSTWAFEQPDTVRTREGELQQGFNKADEIAAEKDRVLQDDLARETFRENLRLKNEQHIDRHSNLKTWVGESKKYLETVDPVDSIPEADTNLLNLEAWNADFADVTSINVSGFKRLGAELLSAKYETSYSHYELSAETSAALRARESEIDADWKQLSQLGEAKKAVLEADLAREKRKEELRLQFANAAQDFTRWTNDLALAAPKTVFGFTLEEVEAFDKTLAALDSSTAADAEKKTAAYTRVYDELVSLKVTSNIYTKLTPDTLAQSRAAMQAALQARRAKFDEELARQRANDKLCKDFAALVEPFVQRIDASKDSLANSKKDAEAQLVEVQEKIAETSKDDFGLAQVKALQQQIDERGISDNRHTIVTAKDAEVVWQQYIQFLQRKKVTIEEEIAHKKLRGLTEQQMREIEVQFQQFDKNKNGSLDRNEFKTCLYSLNEDKTKQEVTKIMEKYGSDGVIRFEGFREFMISVLGDTDTKEEVIEGFVLINKGSPATDDELMGLVLPDDDIAYIKTTAPQKDKGYDYTAWTEEVYAR